ncbi:hypothetical protein FRC10_000072 [Ceratobasidium sp. 414]|nr:hypothetical protein FRC10_000072 [Ceratobasidium sp. 414]
MVTQRPNRPKNYDIHVHPSMRSALNAYLDTATINPAHTHHAHPHAPPSQPAPQGAPDMLSGLLLEDAVLHNATKKIHNPIDKMYFLGVLGGMWIGFGGLAAVSAAGGVPEDVRDRWVVLPKLLMGRADKLRPVALHMVIMFGGEIFAGNTMILSIGVYNRVVPLKPLLINWLVVYIGNWSGCLIASYFFGYLTDIYASESYRSFLASVIVSKLEAHGWGVLFLKAIPANAMVCMATMMGMASRDSAGKIMALWFPVVMFVLCGYEHCVANRLMYGAPSTIRRQWFNQSAVIPGNMVGGAIVVGLAEHLMNHWHSPFFHADDGAGTLASHDVESTRRARDVRDVHPADLVARVRAILHAENHRTEHAKRSDGSGGNSETPTPDYVYNGGTPLNLAGGHEDALERRKAMRAQLGMKGFATWFGHGPKSEKEDPSTNV